MDKNILKLNNSFEEHAEENLSDRSYVIPISPNETTKEHRQIKVNKLFKLLAENKLGCDLSVCFFVCALNSYRADRCLRPFPSAYLRSNIKDFMALRKVCDIIPPIWKISKNPEKCSTEVIELLLWLFLEKGQSLLKRVRLADIPLPGTISDVFKPTYVFEVFYQKKVEQLWHKRRNKREIILAYHGSTIDNFYSILRVGLQQHFSVGKEVLFGNGIYLSTELQVSAHYSPFGRTWDKSILGAKHSVIAVCEIINDMKKVKYKDSKCRSRTSGQNDLPEKYFVVTDSDMVRVKYLLVYKQQNFATVKSFLTKNIFWVMIVLYSLMLGSVSFLHSSAWRRFSAWFYE